MRVFLMFACGLVAGEFHPQFRGHVLIRQRGIVKLWRKAWNVRRENI